jgi:hemin uptake protein HemP
MPSEPGHPMERTLQLRVTRNIIVGNRPVSSRLEGRVSHKLPELNRVGPGDRPIPRISSTELLQGGREIVIQHGTDEYRLRLTSKLKLILTK